MATGLPAGQKLEIEFTPGVWTDVTADVDFAAGIPITRGRNSVASQPSVGSMVFQLDNSTGKYTPLRQVLADGVTAHPYWPNLLPRLRCRYSNTPAGVRGVMYVKGWPPQLENGVRGIVTIVAYDRLKYLSKVNLKSPMLQEITQDSPVAWYPFTDAAGSTVAVDATATSNPNAVITGSGAALTFGAVGPGVGDGTGLQLAGGKYLAAPFARWWPSFVTKPNWTIEICLQTTGNTYAVFNDDLDGQFLLTIDAAGKAAFSDQHDTYQGTTAINDGAWHHIAATYTSTGTVRRLYVDGVQQYTSSGFAAQSGAYSGNLLFGRLAPNVTGFNPFVGFIGQFAAYNTVLSAARVASHAAAVTGYFGDTTGTRISRYLAAAGLTSADWNLDTGKAIVGTYPQAGKTVLQACQDMADTEGAGAVVYAFQDGKIRFADRTFRKPGAPVLTLDAVQDLELSPYDPAFDDESLVNSSTVSRSAESGTLSTQTVTNAASIAQYEVTTGDVTSYATTDQDALNLAQSRVSADANPGFRLPQVAGDLMSAENNLYASLANVEIGSRIRITNLPAGYAPATQVDIIMEGLAETPSTDSYLAVFDVSPADNPARGVWDDTSYGRWQCSGQTLNANITNSATTLAIATAGTLPTFTTVSARYPLKIQIGQEIITLNSAPGGATSPQTFTGVTRGVNGTSAAAQAAGATVNLWPAVTWTL
jgi:hypothetical protein